MSLVPAVTELMLAELLYLQYDSPTRPIYMYINSTGVAVRRKCPAAARLPSRAGNSCQPFPCTMQPPSAGGGGAPGWPGPAHAQPPNHPPPQLQKGAGKLGYEAEAFAIYDTMRFIKPPVCGWLAF